MKLIYLGTSSGIPTLTRNMSCVAIELDDKKVWLVDCGAGTQQQMLKANIWIGRVEKVFITHLHGDHCYDIVGILALRSMRQIDTPLEVVGPVGIKEMIQTVMRVSQLYVGFQLDITELEPNLPYQIGWRNDDNWHITAYPLTHRVPCFGYVFKERDQLGRFDAAKARAAGVSGALIGKLAREDSVTLKDGTIVRQIDCMAPSFAGRKVVILGDTENSDMIAEAALQCDVISHETTFDVSMLERALRSGHSTTHMHVPSLSLSSYRAAEFAHSIQASNLIITHFSARYTDRGAEITVSDLLNETKQRLAELDSAVVAHAADDFWEFEIPEKKAPPLQPANPANTNQP